MIEIRTIGGYGEIGKNCTAVKIGNEVVIFDMGIHLPNYITFTDQERDHLVKMSTKALKKAEAIPDDLPLNEWKHMVKAIVPSHAHLDHIGAIPYLAKKYNAPILCTPFTAEVLKAIMKDNKQKIPNKIKTICPNSSYQVSDDLKISFINITHSTAQCSLIALETKEGVVLYGTDFKIDDKPIVGKKPNYKKLEQLSKKGIRVAFVDSLNAPEEKKTPSESVAREMLKDVLLSINTEGRTLIVTTYSSHIARLKTIVECGKLINRKVVFIGRSLAKYAIAAKKAGIYSFEGVKMAGYPKQIKKELERMQKKGTENYLIVTTGHQGEPKSVLMKIIDGKYKFPLGFGDAVVYSCKVIPTEINILHRKEMEKRLKSLGVRIFKDIHVSGHASREDLRDFLELINAENIIPLHGEDIMEDELVNLAREIGYDSGKIHKLNNWDYLKLDEKPEKNNKD